MPLDQLGRRSRFARTRVGKRVQLTDRDLDVLRWLHRYRYLTAPQLIAILRRRSLKRFVERLGDLYHETGLVGRPGAQWQGFDARCRPLIYALSTSGLRLLEYRDQVPPRAVTVSRRSSARRSVQWEHSLMVIETLLKIELATMATPGQRFVPVDEILTRAPEATRTARNPLAAPVTLQPSDALSDLKRPWHTHIIPDALYGIEYEIDGEKRYRFWALECENTTPERRSSARHSSIARKRAAYDALIASRAYRDHWGIPNLKLNLVNRTALGRGERA
ncbi:MAG: replication-relaxation family protein [Silicimonas sp.]|jgi:hypothetical protein|uniref:replication-relaxation family protein n=1 Tax=Roseitalea porphyridii TaxID=1852022 RepID=UPI0032F02911